MANSRIESHAVFSKKGVKGTACLGNGMFCDCNVKINVNRSEKQANITLTFHFDDGDQRVVLIFNANNIITGSIHFEAASITDPYRSRVERRKGNELTAFLFKSDRCGTILYTRGFQRDSSTCVRHLGLLATSTSIRIVIDLDGWITPDLGPQLRSHIAEIDTFSAIPVSKRHPTLSKLVEVGDWNELPKKDAFLDPGPYGNFEGQEAPPAYPDSVLPSYTKTSLKRTRQRNYLRALYVIVNAHTLSDKFTFTFGPRYETPPDRTYDRV